MRKWRLIFSGMGDPAGNMAEDEAILDGYLNGVSQPTLRIYGWRPSGISLGFFQDAEEVVNTDACGAFGIPFVRRMTGGEIIFHDEELSYSIVCSDSDLELPRHVKESYRVLTSFVIDTYKALGLQADFSGAYNAVGHSSFCFGNRQEFDICIRGRKIGGNAQKRLKHIIFQHGSIPFAVHFDKIRYFLREDIAALKDGITSLGELCAEPVSFEKLACLMSKSFEKRFGVILEPSGLNAYESEKKAVLLEEKYLNPEWNMRPRGAKETVFQPAER